MFERFHEPTERRITKNRMNATERFELCQRIAARIVRSYRDEAPEGCDPKNSWVAAAGLAGAAISAGAQYASGQQQQGAISDAAGALANPTLFEPTTIETPDLLSRTYNDVFANVRTAEKITNRLNTIDYKQAVKFLNMIQPRFTEIQGQVGSNALNFARGQLPADVVSSIQRSAAQQGIQGGFGYGSGGARTGMLANLNLRNLGLTSLDLSKYGTQLGMQVNQSAKSLLPNLGSVRDWLLSLPQQIDIEKTNTDILNTAGMYNTNLMNQAQQAQAQGILQGGLTGAATTAGIGQTIGGAVSGLGSLFGPSSGGGLVNPVGTYPNSFVTNPDPTVRNQILPATLA